MRYGLLLGFFIFISSCTAIDSGKDAEKQMELQSQVNKILEKYNTEESEMVLIGKVSAEGDTIVE